MFTIFSSIRARHIITMLCIFGSFSLCQAQLSGRKYQVETLKPPSPKEIKRLLNDIIKLTSDFKKEHCGVTLSDTKIKNFEKTFNALKGRRPDYLTGMVDEAMKMKPKPDGRFMGGLVLLLCYFIDESKLPEGTFKTGSDNYFETLGFANKSNKDTWSRSRWLWTGPIGNRHLNVRRIMYPVGGSVMFNSGSFVMNAKHSRIFDQFFK